MQDLIIIGGGLAGCEAAWQAAQRGIHVTLYEMRPNSMTGAHTSPHLAELVCSNSLGSNLRDRPSGLLKQEIKTLHSLLLDCAEQSALPAGGALAVDRGRFAELVTARIEAHPNISVVRQEVTVIPDQPAIIASGPLTSPALAHALQALTGREHLFFFDAIAPVVTLESINFDIAFRGSRFSKGTQAEGDYINCPFTQEQYDRFVDALLSAETVQLHEFERDITTGVRAGHSSFFEGCLPIEEIARRGQRALAFGPLRPIGLKDPHTGTGARAVLQLRQDNLANSLYNLVGFQTNLTIPEQRRVFRMIPGLENAEFAHYGQMHRNTFLASPTLLLPTLQYKNREDLLFAGQIIGVEGYVGNIATGLLAGINAARILSGQDPLTLPLSTMLGSLCNYITTIPEEQFQPMKANFGILPPLIAPGKEKRDRSAQYVERSLSDLHAVLPKFFEAL